ncbi:hypothetical protein NC653_017625 [Populus alba x Populus x berolinensis]|uniref:Uncharacterized protein n=1 Tax=Populus alba x Populus x berolinensis TaxID=444605 RepID=A0AAD6QR70_9ROSI|nr:hypothetical protein NC653_017625 [Populus alba x Populus x berolinensis]
MEAEENGAYASIWLDNDGICYLGKRPSGACLRRNFERVHR